MCICPLPLARSQKGKDVGKKEGIRDFSCLIPHKTETALQQQHCCQQQQLVVVVVPTYKTLSISIIKTNQSKLFMEMII
jgi:hypothetical protein